MSVRGPKIEVDYKAGTKGEATIRDDGAAKALALFGSFA